MIADRFRETAAAHGEEIAIVDGALRISYAQLAAEVAQTRAWLEDSCAGGASGRVIAVSLHNSWQFAASFLAILEAGAVILPCNPSWRAAELDRLHEQLPIAAAFTADALRGEWERMARPPASILSWDRRPGHATPTSRPASRPPDSPHLYLVTSGSTGTPKIVPRTGRNLMFSIEHIAPAIGVARGMKWLSSTAFFHSWGVHTGVTMPLLFGGTLVILPQFQAAACAELIRREQVNVLLASPFAYGFLGEQISRREDLASLERCFWSGSRMREDVVDLWRQRFGIRLRGWYGMSEANVLALDLSANDAPQPLRDGFVGQPAPGADVRVCDADGRFLAGGEPGEIVIRSSGVMPGYLNATSRDAFFGDFFRTGDLGRIDVSGNLYLTGRVQMRINIAGLKVDAAEIEQVVEQLDAVAACRVDSVSGGPAGEMIRARILLRGAGELSRREVVAHCRRFLAEYKIPRQIEFTDSASALPGKMPR